eukprot:TRINITY_DN9287_c0_g1_i1.p1 TRINITY_DN9287_c0_g1~~TRINITY_DN9287_c0_g1_i1.p1  ORF type:complete len:232 (+),score=71.53 TRINITY_DN9287_c0_g1_i1:53-748(+)
MGSASFDVRTLRVLHDEIANATTAFDEWLRTQYQSLQSATNERIRQKDQTEGTLLQLQEQEKILRLKLEQLAQASKQQQREMENMQQDFTKGSAKRENLSSQIARTEEIIASETKQLAALKQDNMILEKQVSEIEKNIQRNLFFRQQLGMQIDRRGDDQLQFAFTNIDPRQPSRAFWFVVLLDEQNYQVTQCEPRIPEIGQLVATLNETNNFAAFLAEARESFLRIGRDSI